MGRLRRIGLEPARRYERQRPGELIHIDVKKLGRIEGGAGHRMTGRAGQPADAHHSLGSRKALAAKALRKLAGRTSRTRQPPGRSAHLPRDIRRWLEANDGRPSLSRRAVTDPAGRPSLR